MIQCRLAYILADRKVKKIEPYTQLAVAEAAGLSEGTISGLVNNRTSRYDEHVLDGLCRVLGCQVGDILRYVPDEQEGD